MSWEYLVLTIFIIICGFVQLFYHLLHKVCVDMLNGNFPDENDRPLKLSNEQKSVIETLSNTAKSMRLIGGFALGINIVLAFSLKSDPSLILKGIAAFLDARIILAALQVMKDATMIGSYVQK